MHPLTLFGPVDSLAETEVIAGKPLIVFVLFVLVVINMITRLVAYRSHVRQAEDGPEAIVRHPIHMVSTLVLILGCFYLMTFDTHPGTVLSVLVIGTFLADFFEIEVQKVRARKDRSITRPSGALAGSVLVFLYVSYLSVFFIIKPVWSAII